MTNAQLRGQRAEVLREARALSSKGKLNAADQRTFDTLMAEAERIKQQYEEIENRGLAPIKGGAIETRVETTRERDHKEAFRSYLRGGITAMPQEHRSLLEKEYRDMGVGTGNSITGPGGAFLVPVSFSDAIETALKFSGNLMRYCTIYPTETGAPMPWPTADDTQQQAELIGEGVQVTTQDVPLSNVVFGAYKYSSKMVKVSLELIQDSYFPIEEWLTGVLATRFSRALNQHFTTGTGTGQPKGLITAAVAAGNIVNAVGSSSNTGNADGKNTIGSTDLQNVIHACDPLYREDPSCRLLMHDQTRKYLGQVLDKYGRPLFPQSLVSGAPDMICGYEVGLDNAMDQLQSAASSPPVTKYTIAFGPMKKYLFRRVRDMSLMVLTERFADYAQIAYIAYMRADGNLLTAAQESAQAPIALLANVF